MKMNEDEYLEKRVHDQIDWFNRKSASSKCWFYRFKAAETILALLIPFLTAYITDGCIGLKISVGIIGILVAALAGFITLFKLQENWVQYRTMSEMLTQERFLYLAETGTYKDADRFKLFVERIENMLTKENAQWASNIKTLNDKAKEEKQS